MANKISRQLHECQITLEQHRWRLNMHILWFGPLVPADKVQDYPGISPAANKWQIGLIKGLEENGVKVTIASHVPYRTWPYGPMRITGGGNRVNTNHYVQASYWNILPMREWSLVRGYKTIIPGLLDGQIPDVIMSYNLSSHDASILRWVSMQWDTIQVPVIADLPTEDAAAFDRFQRNVLEYDGVVCLSWKAAQESWMPEPLHLDGGVEHFSDISPDLNNEKQILFYAGAFNHWAGIDQLLDAFALLPGNNLQLWLCGGSGDDKGIIRAAEKDPRIIYYGRVDDERLHSLMCQADIFVNPRPPEVPGNEWNYPSKLLTYLSYGKPIVSTWTDGLCPEYRDILVLAENGTPTAIAGALNSVIQMTTLKRREYFERYQMFCTQGHLWTQQARRLLNYIEIIKTKKTSL